MAKAKRQRDGARTPKRGIPTAAAQHPECVSASAEIAVAEQSCGGSQMEPLILRLARVCQTGFYGTGEDLEQLFPDLTAEVFTRYFPRVRQPASGVTDEEARYYRLNYRNLITDIGKSFGDLLLFDPGPLPGMPFVRIGYFVLSGERRPPLWITYNHEGDKNLEA